MKKIILISSVISLVLTLFLGEILSIYSFGSYPTLLTSLYLITMFVIINYLVIVGTYIVKKVIKKEKISLKKIIGLILLFISIVLVLLCILIIDIDHLHWYMYSSPFYLNVIFRCVEFLVPGIILFIISIFLIRKK